MTDWKARDLLLAPHSSGIWVVEWNRYAKKPEFRELLPLGPWQDVAPADAVLLAREVQGRLTPVVDLFGGDLYAVETLRPRIVRAAEPPDYDKYADDPSGDAA